MKQVMVVRTIVDNTLATVVEAKFCHQQTWRRTLVSCTLCIQLFTT